MQYVLPSQGPLKIKITKWKSQCVCFRKQLLRHLQCLNKSLQSELGFSILIEHKPDQNLPAPQTFFNATFSRAQTKAIASLKDCYSNSVALQSIIGDCLAHLIGLESTSIFNINSVPMPLGNSVVVISPDRKFMQCLSRTFYRSCQFGYLFDQSTNRFSTTIKVDRSVYSSQSIIAICLNNVCANKDITSEPSLP